MSDLAGLIERVREATGPDRALDAALAVGIAGWTKTPLDWTDNFGRKRNHPEKWTSSTDAALALVERKLPNLVIKATKLGDGSGLWQITEAWFSDTEVVDDFSPMEPRPGALAVIEVLLLALLTSLQEISHVQP